MTSILLRTAGLLFASNLFMTVAWYEYVLQVPANRIGYTALSLPQLKIMQEAITLGAVYFMFRGHATV